MTVISKNYMNQSAQSFGAKVLVSPKARKSFLREIDKRLNTYQSYRHLDNLAMEKVFGEKKGRASRLLAGFTGSLVNATASITGYTIKFVKSVFPVEMILSEKSSGKNYRLGMNTSSLGLPDAVFDIAKPGSAALVRALAGCADILGRNRRDLGYSTRNPFYVLSGKMNKQIAETPQPKMPTLNEWLDAFYSKRKPRTKR